MPPKPVRKRPILPCRIRSRPNDLRLTQVQDQLYFRRLHLLMQAHYLKSSPLQIHFPNDLQHGGRGAGQRLAPRNRGQVALLDELVPCETFELCEIQVVYQLVLIPRGPYHVHGHLRRPGNQMRVSHVALHEVVVPSKRVY